MPSPTEPAPSELPGWDVAIGPGGPEDMWWCALVSSGTDKHTHRSLPGPSRPTPAVTSTRYTLRGLALPRVPGWGEGRVAASPRQRCEIVLTWQTGDPWPQESTVLGQGAAAGLGTPQREALRLDGERVLATVQRGPGLLTPESPTWRAVGALVLPAGPSKALPVTFEVTGFGVADLPRDWSTLPVATLLQHRDVWLAP